MLVGSKKIYVERLPSTNSHAAWLLRRGKVQEGTVVQAGFQTAGRGQGSNTWESANGKNLLFSIVLYPIFVRADKQFSVSKMISLGIRDYLSSTLSEVYIKWPNDIYVSNDKIAGILIENAIIRSDIEHTIAGIGLNINQEKFSASAGSATSLKILTGRDHELDRCLDGVLASIDRRYSQLKDDRRSRISNDYLQSLCRFGQFTEFNDSRGLFEGKIINVTDTGRLQIEDRKGRIYEYGHREVDFL
jgi:BirA family transcriptional regulator, biotin operon repressor / biotin---[acetyl-CoA-carboxylase] ligase